jgi:hypothetical protein
LWTIYVPLGKVIANLFVVYKFSILSMSTWNESCRKRKRQKIKERERERENYRKQSKRERESGTMNSRLQKRRIESGVITATRKNGNIDTEK